MKKTDTRPRHLDSAGCLIVECCASCIYKKYKTENTRKCSRRDTIIMPSDPPCDGYRPISILRDGCRIGQGQVRRKAYLDFFCKNSGRIEAEVKEELGAHAGITEIILRARAEFKRTTGISPFYKF